MQKINNRSFTRGTQNEGGPVRKLAAAARAVMEPIEHRMMMSATPAAVLNHQVSTITAKYETQAMPKAGTATVDPAVWINPKDASLSTIIGTDHSGGLSVYDLAGKQIQYIEGSSYNSVDVRTDFTLDGKTVSVVAASNLDDSSISLFTVSPTTRRLNNVTAGTIKTSIGGTVSDLTMYQSAQSGKTYVFVSNKSGKIEQFELSDNGHNEITAKSVRTITVGATAEGMVTDDESGALYVSEEHVGIWKYGAEPTDGSVRVEIDSNDSSGHLTADVESLAIYKGHNGTGYLIASSQGSEDYVVYDRESGSYVTRFKVGNGASIDGTSHTEGIEVVSASLGNSLPDGAFIVHDSDNTTGTENFKIVSWGDIARSQAVPLAIDSSQVPHTMVAATAAKVTTTAKAAPTTAGVTSLSLYDMNTGKKITTLQDGATIDLSQLQGSQLNVRAAVSDTKGSVVWAINGKKSWTENYAPFYMNGDSGDWQPTAGTYTISGTFYSEKFAGGQASSAFEITLKVVGSRSGTVSKPVATVKPAAVVKPVTSSVVDTLTAPAAATKLTATASGTDKVTLKWTAGARADGYIVERSTEGGKYVQVAMVTTANYTNTGLTDGTEYSYRVTAYNDAGSSKIGNVATVTTATKAAPRVEAEEEVAASGNRPSAANTGPDKSIKLTSVSNFKAQSNTTYEGLSIKGQVNLNGLTNVKFINCVIDGNNDAWAIRCDTGGSNNTIQNCEIFNVSSAAIYGGGFKAINNYIHHSGGDGFKPTHDVVIQGNYITQLGWGSPDAHADGIQIRGGSNIRISGNYFDIANGVANTKSNSALFLQLDASNVEFDGNWINGGNFSVHAYADGGNGGSIKITNNTYYAGSAKFGFCTIGLDVILSGNVTETGKAALTSTK